MMNNSEENITENFITALKNGVVPATGCTEPIAVAYGAAVAKKYLGSQLIKNIFVDVSLNILKNAMAVIVPGTGKPGLKVAAAAGVLVGDPEAKLKVISNITDSDLPSIAGLVDSNIIQIKLADVDDDLYVHVKIIGVEDIVEVWIAGEHTNIFQISRNNQSLFSKTRPQAHEKSESKLFLQRQSLRKIWDFATTTSIDNINFMVKSAQLNLALASEGLTKTYGLNLGHSLHSDQTTLDNKILTYTVAASDARMGGSKLAAMSNSGSGNQGITATIPVCVIAQEIGVDDDKLIRALTLSHLTALYIHAFLPVLSAFCAADSAAMGAAVGCCYLLKNDYDAACMAIKNMAGDALGMICDGAGCACAMKVASAVSSMYRATILATKGIVIPTSNGLICEDIDDTIKAIGKLGTKGMQGMDPVIVDIMTEKKFNI